MNKLPEALNQFPVPEASTVCYVGRKNQRAAQIHTYATPPIHGQDHCPISSHSFTILVFVNW